MKLRSRIVAFVLLLVLFTATISTTVGGVLKDIKLGLDLQGGFEVLYEVTELKEGQKITPEVVAATAEALDERINAIGVKRAKYCS